MFQNTIRKNANIFGRFIMRKAKLSLTRSPIRLQSRAETIFILGVSKILSKNSANKARSRHKGGLIFSINFEKLIILYSPHSFTRPFTSSDTAIIFRSYISKNGFRMKRTFCERFSEMRENNPR